MASFSGSNQRGAVEIRYGYATYVYSDVVNIGCFPNVTVLELLQKSTSLKTFSIIQ